MAGPSPLLFWLLLISFPGQQCDDANPEGQDPAEMAKKYNPTAASPDGDPASRTTSGGHSSEKCKKLETQNTNIGFNPDQEHYNENDMVTVTCPSQYTPSHTVIRCIKRDQKSVWDPPNVSCIEQCKTPTSTGIDGRSYSPKAFYNRGRSIAVKCLTGYSPTSRTITCVSSGTGSDWDVSIPCTEQCKKTTLTGIDGRYYTRKDFYNRDEQITVRCLAGYSPTSRTIKCVSSGTGSDWDVSVPCTEQCKKPTSNGINSYYLYKDTYNPGDDITVRCMMGYSPPSRTITCVSSGASSTWDVSVPCVAQCRKPTSAGLDPGTPQYKSYYNPDEVITVQCMMGYFPISKTMRCVNDGARSNWNVSVPCVASVQSPGDFCYAAHHAYLSGGLNSHPFPSTFNLQSPTHE
ncbi:complement factor H-like [Discoglossus pictus]